MTQAIQVEIGALKALGEAVEKLQGRLQLLAHSIALERETGDTLDLYDVTLARAELARRYAGWAIARELGRTEEG